MIPRRFLPLVFWWVQNGFAGGFAPADLGAHGLPRAGGSADNDELDGEVDDGARSHPRERLVPAVENTPGDMWGKWGVAYGKIGSVMQWLVSVSYRFTRPALVSNVDGIQLGKKYKEAGRSSGATR